MKYAVAIENTGESYSCAADRNLLAAMEQLGRRGIPVGCRNGGCGICKVKILAGQVATRVMSRAHVSVDEEANGIVLACRAFPRSAVNLLALDKMAACIEKNFVPAHPIDFAAIPRPSAGGHAQMTAAPPQHEETRRKPWQ